jgi:ferric-dicitrate binding protein FerR (iron transport regulator)
MKETFEIIYAVLTGSASAEEKERFEGLMEEEENRQLFNQIQKIWEESKAVRSYKKYDARRSFQELTRKIQEKKRRRKQQLWIGFSGVAAGLALMLGISNFLGISEGNQNPGNVIFATQLGNRSVIYLPDSSRVWLNSSSSLQYSGDFNKKNRTVRLKGEGYFEVAHSKKPFVVNVGPFNIKVYGTHFNVSAYQNDLFIKTCLAKGKISIQRTGYDEYMVKPGELITYDKADASFSKKNVDPDEYSGWRKNLMYMHNESLENLSRKLERRYNVKISFEPEKLGEEVHYTGTFSNENIEEVLDAISIASGLQFSKKDNLYTITRNNQKQHKSFND